MNLCSLENSFKYDVSGRRKYVNKTRYEGILFKKLTTVLFSKKNIKLVSDNVRYLVHKETGRKIPPVECSAMHQFIGQGIEEYQDYEKTSDTSYHIRKINIEVITDLAEELIGNIYAANKYEYHLNHAPIPTNLPVYNRIRGHKLNEGGASRLDATIDFSIIGDYYKRN